VWYDSPQAAPIHKPPVVKIRELLSRAVSGKFGRDFIWNVGSLIVLALGGVAMNTLLITLSDEVALGVFNQIFAFFIVLSQFGVGGIQFSTLKHISYAQDNRPLAGEITFSAMLLISLISLPLLLIVWLSAPALGNLLQSADVGQGLRYATPGLFFFALNKALINVLNGLRNMRAYAVFRAVRFLLLPGFIVAIILLGYNNAWLGLALTLTEFILFILLILYIYVVTRLVPLRRGDHLAHHLRQHFSFGTRGLLSGVLNEANTRVDVIMLGYFLGDSLVGIYSFAATIAEGFSLLPVALRNNLDPLLGQHFATDKTTAIDQLAQRVRRYFVPGMVAIGLIAVAGYPVLLALIGDPTLYDSWGVFAILSAAIALTSGYYAFHGLLLQGGRPGTHTVMIVIMVTSNITLNILLIPVFGLYGAATATGLTFVINALLLIVFARRIWNIRL